MIISIITINFNNKIGLEKTIQSVIQQTYKSFEFIVIDGSSADGSKDVICEYQSHFSYFVSEPDTGIYNAMNKGILKAKGEYLLFLNSGDILVNKDVIKNALIHLNIEDVISGDILIVENYKTNMGISKDEISLDWFFNISLYHQATFIKRKLFFDYGMYNESFKIGGDYEFFIRLFFREKCTYKHVNIIVAKFTADGISNNLAYLEINRQEVKVAWLLNVSEATYKEFDRYYTLLQTDEVYLKSRSRFFNVTTKFSKFLYSIKFFIYKKIKKQLSYEINDYNN